MSYRHFAFLLLSAAALHAQKPMSNDDVLRLVEQHLSTAQIVERINSAPSRFRLDFEDIEKLQRAGVPEIVVKAMNARQIGKRLDIRGVEIPTGSMMAAPTPLPTMTAAAPAQEPKAAPVPMAPVTMPSASAGKVSGGAVRGDDTAYSGGTLALPVGTRGALDLGGRDSLRFCSLVLPYSNITSMEFGQKVGRRVGATVALGVTTLGVGALPMLFSKKKKHYLTVGFTADGHNEVMVLEIAKGLVRSTLPVLESRTGKKIAMEDPKKGRERS